MHFLKGAIAETARGRRGAELLGGTASRDPPEGALNNIYTFRATVITGKWIPSHKYKHIHPAFEPMEFFTKTMRPSTPALGPPNQGTALTSPEGRVGCETVYEEESPLKAEYVSSFYYWRILNNNQCPRQPSICPWTRGPLVQHLV